MKDNFENAAPSNSLEGWHLSQKAKPQVHPGVARVDTVSTVVPRLMLLALGLENGNNAIAESLRGTLVEKESQGSPILDGLVGTLMQIERHLERASILAEEAHSILN